MAVSAGAGQRHEHVGAAATPDLEAGPVLVRDEGLVGRPAARGVVSSTFQPAALGFQATTAPSPSTTSLRWVRRELPGLEAAQAALVVAVPLLGIEPLSAVCRAAVRHDVAEPGPDPGGVEEGLLDAQQPGVGVALLVVRAA